MQYILVSGMTVEVFKEMLDSAVSCNEKDINFVAGVPDAVLQIDVFDTETGERYVGAEALSYIVATYYKEQNEH